MAEVEVGKVTHYFGHLGVAAIALTGELRVGDTIHVVGHTSDFTQRIDSMQIDRKEVPSAGAGATIGIKAKEHARPHDVIYKVTV